jgi:GTP-binding protein Era
MKAGFIAIIGKPNVGKSTLLNRLMHFKLSIVTSKPQTTRQRILGILTEGDHQCCFLDTPGMIEPAYELQKAMVDQVKCSLDDADVIVYVVDPWFKDDPMIQDIKKTAGSRPIICAINKIDLVQKTDLLVVIRRFQASGVTDIIPVSARNGDGIEELKMSIFRLLPDGPFLYPPEHLSVDPERFFAAELIREAIFKGYEKEIPYATCVMIDEFTERQGAKDYIRAIIYVERRSQKGILIGKKGEALKKTGATARKGIERFLGRPVFLELWVKVKKDWRKDKKFLKEAGL